MSTRTPKTLETQHTLKGTGPLPPASLVGERLDDRYDLIELVGEGGMGVVFRAKQLSVNRDVAIKVMRSEVFEDDFSLVRRFQLEMEIVSSLQHPNIVRLFDTGEDKRLGVVFLVMEYVEGLSLGGLLFEDAERVALKPALALEICAQICAALTEPHQLNVIHRDLKPDNIMLTARSDELLEVKLLDFGVARVLKSSEEEQRDVRASSRLTATGGIVGTPPYIAPELCESSRSVSVQSDLYAVGALFFEMLTGFAPYEGRSVAEVLYKHVHAEVPHLNQRAHLEPGLDADLDALIRALLSKSQTDRPSSALEVKRELERLRRVHDLAVPTLPYTAAAPRRGAFVSMMRHVDEHALSVEAPVQTRVDYTETLPRPIMAPAPESTAEHAEEIDDQDFEKIRARLGMRRSKRTLVATAIAALLAVAALIALIALPEDAPSEQSNAQASSDESTDRPSSIRSSADDSKVTPSSATPTPSLRQAPRLSEAITPARSAVLKAQAAAAQACEREATERASARKAASTPPTSPQVGSKKREAVAPQKPSKLKTGLEWLHE